MRSCTILPNLLAGRALWSARFILVQLMEGAAATGCCSCLMLVGLKRTKWFSLPRLETRTKESNICASTGECCYLRCGMKVTVAGMLGNASIAQSAGLNPSGERSECEHACWDPKDGELCLSRVKPGETLVEARSDSDVQIDRRTRV